MKKTDYIPFQTYDGVSCSVLITTDNKGQQYYTSTQFTERLSVALGVLFTASVCSFILSPKHVFLLQVVQPRRVALKQETAYCSSMA